MSAQESLLFTISGSASAVLWVVAYGLIIRRGFKDRSYGMPFAPLCVNLSYEFIFGMLYPDAPPLNYANQIWFAIDLIIFYQFIRFGKSEFERLLPSAWFLPAVALSVLLAFGGVLAVTLEFHDFHGNYTGWGDQLLISISFIWLLARRGSIAGQSVYIALSRMMGSIVLIPGQMIQGPADSVLLGFIYVSFATLDAIYIVLLIRQCRLEGINPWRRL